MDDALALQSFLIQRLVGLLVAEEPCDYRISAGRGCRPLSPLLIYGSCMIRDQIRKAGDAGEEGEERSGGQSRGGRKRSD